MRIIPKNTKVKIQFYKNVSIADVVLGIIALGFISLAVSSNLPSKFIIAIGIAMVTFPLYIPIGDLRLYNLLFVMCRFGISKKTFNKEKRNITTIIPYSKIENNLIKLKEAAGYIGVLEVKPIEFNLLSQNKQNFLIDGVIANIFKNCGIFQEINIVKLCKPMILDNYIKNEFTRMQELIESKENKELQENEFKNRIDLVEERINLVDNLNTNFKIYTSNYYITIIDLDKKALQNSLDLALISLMNNGLETKQLNDLELAMFIKYSYDNEFEEKDFKELSPNELLKKAAPSNISFKGASTKQNNKTLTHFIITDYPLKVDNAWGQDLFDLEDTKVVFKAKPVDKYKGIKRIDNAINELITQNTSNRASSQIDKTTHIESLQLLLEGLQNDNEMFFDCNLIITVYDENKSVANKKFVRRRLKELGFKFTEMFGRQQEVYLTSSLTFYDKTKISRGLNSSIIAACFPFVSNEILDENGILIGENKLPCFIDFFKRNDERVNSNMIVIGKSGSGKSFATKTILSHLSSDNAKVFILDPENEYGTLAKNLDGTVLDVSSSKDGRINPFHIITSLDDENTDGTRNSFYAHLQFLEEFFKLILTGINSDSLELLNKIILEIYKTKGITAKTDLSNLNAEDFPTFQDLVELIDKKLKYEQDDYNKGCFKVLANYLSKFKDGERNSALWNGYTTFNPIENFVCFNFQKLLANKNNLIANAQMLLVLKWLDNEIIKNRDYNTIYGCNRKIIVAIDEAHVFIDEKFPIALDFMYQLAKRIRKYNGMQIVITQNIKDFVGSPEIARKSSAIINVSQYSLIFSLAPNDMSDLCSLYEKAGQINDSESENIVNLPRGNAFFIFGPANRTNIKIEATPFIRELFENKK